MGIVKIIHCLAYYLPEKLAGTEVYAHELAKRMANAEIIVEVVTPNQGKNTWNIYTHEGIGVTQYPEASERTKALIQGKIPPTGIELFRQILIEKQPDIIHFHEITGSTGITIHHFRVAYELGIKVVFTMHLSHYTCNTGTLFYAGKTACDGKLQAYKCAYCTLRVQKQLHPAGAATLAGASWLLNRIGIDPRDAASKIGTALAFAHGIQDIKTRLQQIVQYTSKICVLTHWYKKVLLDNGVPEDKLVLIPQALPIKEQVNAVPPIPVAYPLQLIFIGRIDPLKGLDILLRAIKKVDASQIELHIYGSVTDESYYQHCQKLAASLPAVYFKGALSRTAVLQQISSAHFLCLPSTFSEMSPLVIQEAFAVGVPVIGSNVAGIQEQIQPGYNGLLFQLGDAADLADKLRAVLQDMTIVEKLRQNIVPPRSFECLAAEMLQVYQNL